MSSLSYSQIFLIFFKLGCLSFGGPAAHLVFFHQTFVQRLHWLKDEDYAQVVALAQLLPGPTSSQVGLAIGYLKRGYLGSVVAWLGFTLPSFFLIFATLPHWSWLMHQDKIKHAVIGINAAVVGLLLALIVDMGQDYLTSVLDLAFVMFVIVLLKSKLPVWVSLIGSFGVYMGLLSLLS